MRIEAVERNDKVPYLSHIKRMTSAIFRGLTYTPALATVACDVRVSETCRLQ